jgi:hypothetical protein
MKFIKIALIIGIVYACSLLASNQYPINYNTANHKTDTYFTNKEAVPDAFQLKISFVDENYLHTYIRNNGSYTIYVDVYGKFNYLSSGSLQQIFCELRCEVSTINQQTYGTIKIERTINFMGDESEADLREALRKNIITIITNEILKK